MVVGGTEEAYLRAVLARHRIPADRVLLLNVPTPNHVSVMRGGSVDAEVTWEPYGTMTIQQVPGSYGIMRGGGYIGYNLYVESSEEFVGENPDLMQRLADAIVEAEGYVRTHKAEAAEIATPWIEGVDVTDVTYMSFDPRFSRNPHDGGSGAARSAGAGVHQATGGPHQMLDGRIVAKSMRETPAHCVDLKPMP